jgi:hypothetical protein
MTEGCRRDGADDAMTPRNSRLRIAGCGHAGEAEGPEALRGRDAVGVLAETRPA